jgi:phosphoribosyl-ATP pyrophosphohydrolase
VIQDEIGNWHRATFGDTTPDVMTRLCMKLDEEQSELWQVSTSSDNKLISVEMADNLIVLYALADRLGIDLDAAVREKFAIVRGRTDQLERDKDRGIG